MADDANAEEAEEEGEDEISFEEPPLEIPTPRAQFLHFLRLFWSSFVIVMTPLLWLCIFFSGDKNLQALCCFYVVGVILTYWFTGALPLAVTGSLPHLLFPVLGILDSPGTSLQYLKESVFLVLMEYIAAIAISNCKIHTYLLVKIILFTNASHQSLSMILCTASAILTWIVSRTLAVFLILPFVTSLMEALDEEGSIDLIDSGQTKDISHPVPSKIVLGYLLTVLYGANVGAIGTVYGAANNLIARQMILDVHPEMKWIEYQRWFVVFFIPVALNLFITWLWLNYIFFWRNVDDIREQILGVVQERNYTIEPLPTQMVCVCIILVLLLACLLLETPVFFPGLEQMFHNVFKPMDDKMRIRDSSFFILLFFILFMLPGTSSFTYLLSSEKLGGPKSHETRLLPWKKTAKSVHWAMIYIIGCGFALQEGMRKSGAMSMLETFMKNFQDIPSLAALVIICVMILLMTQTLPEIPLMLFFGTICCTLCKVQKIHAVYLVIPAAMCTSMQFLLPWGGESNRLMSQDFKIPVRQMVIAGIVPFLLCPTIVIIFFCTLGKLVFQV